MERIKYPRTYHLPYSQSRTDDDKTLPDDSQFEGMDVVVTIKMDGENTTIYPDGYIHARSLDGNGYAWQNWLKANAYRFNFINEDERIMGENLYAKHSIGYKFNDIEDTFQIFSIGWKNEDENEFYDWNYVEWFCDTYGFKHVPVIYKGIYDKDKIIEAFENKKKELAEQGQDIEGFVVRNVNGFAYNDFQKNVAKFVRANHVQTDSNWKDTWVKNEF